MGQLEKTDDVLWLSHLRKASINIPVGHAASLRVNGIVVRFDPMKPGPRGRLTHGIKAVGDNADYWKTIPKRTIVSIEHVCDEEYVMPTVAPTVPRARTLPEPQIDARTVPAIEPISEAARSRIRPEGAVAGLDVGYSDSRATTGLCVLRWDQVSVTWACRNAHSDDDDRLLHLTAISGNRRMAAAAVDGPLVPKLGSWSHYRACEAILSCGPLQRMGKPGPTNSGSGPRLHAEATRLARFALAHLKIEEACHSCVIHKRGVVEAFPNMFLGSLCDIADYPARPAKNRRWTDTLFPKVLHNIERLLQRLLPGRRIDGRWSRDHEEIASFTCALTALCVASGNYSAVGSVDDGWIALPPKAHLGAGWTTTLTDCCGRARRRFPHASIVWTEST